MKKVATNQGILNMLNKCEIGRVASDDPPENSLLNKELTCNDVCGYYGNNGYNKRLTCIEGISSAGTGGFTNLVLCDTLFTIISNSAEYLEVDCVCCSV